MITVDFAWALAVFFIGNVVLVIAMWVAYTCNDHEFSDVYNVKFIEQCPYCCFVFFEYQKKPLHICPQCQSLIDRKIGKG